MENSRRCVLGRLVMLTSPPQTPEDVFQWRDIGNYSVCGFRVSLRRRSFKFIFNNYIPGALFVLVSWVSFLIPPDLIPGRCLRTTTGGSTFFQNQC